MTLTLGAVLGDPDAFDWRETLYVPPRPWTVETEVLVLPTDDLPADDPIHPEARARGMDELLTMHEVQAIVESLKWEKWDTGIERRLVAFEFYLENDNFADLEDLP